MTYQVRIAVGASPARESFTAFRAVVPSRCEALRLAGSLERLLLQEQTDPPRRAWMRDVPYVTVDIWKDIPDRGWYFDTGYSIT